jgi:hypothetical protein
MLVEHGWRALARFSPKPRRARCTNDNEQATQRPAGTRQRKGRVRLLTTKVFSSLSTQYIRVLTVWYACKKDKHPFVG